ncbi:uncharacterized protein BDZ83DRAFT_764692 [Colletotrichum acutatum]|uniref:Uncharacterized protein n=1 Tax=Glomerella acutata TaxID=27357 RepID=A0AAD8UW25_GLOAC|nr:uncharacterized protein BDZ83DRAFT_764692 [Colletotrichum acutatum]KAK1728749.1 hypothetical protein BDZ83DRAFT_764692 [Colletotrichum acutatum]
MDGFSAFQCSLPLDPGLLFDPISRGSIAWAGRSFHRYLNDLGTEPQSHSPTPITSLVTQPHLTSHITTLNLEEPYAPSPPFLRILPSQRAEDGPPVQTSNRDQAQWPRGRMAVPPSRCNSPAAYCQRQTQAFVLWHTLFQATTDRHLIHWSNQSRQPDCSEKFLVSSRLFEVSSSGTRPRATTAINKDSRDVSNPVIQDPAPHQAQDRLLARIPGSLELEVPCVSNISNPAQPSFHLQKFREYQPLAKVATRTGRRRGSETEVPCFPHRNCVSPKVSKPTQAQSGILHT